MTWLRRLATPTLAIVLAIGLAWWMVRAETAQDARIRLEESRDSAVVAQALQVGNARRVTRAASRAADLVLARLRRTEAEQRARLAAAQDTAAAWQAQALQAIAQLDSGSALRIRKYIDGLQAENKALATLVDLGHEVADTLQADRDRWRAQAEREQALGEAWRQRAVAWKEVAKECRIPLLGLKCPVLVVGPGVNHQGKAGLQLTLGIRP